MLQAILWFTLTMNVPFALSCFLSGVTEVQLTTAKTNDLMRRGLSFCSLHGASDRQHMWLKSVHCTFCLQEPLEVSASLNTSYNGCYSVRVLLRYTMNSSHPCEWYAVPDCVDRKKDRNSQSFMLYSLPSHIPSACNLVWVGCLFTWVTNVSVYFRIIHKCLLHVLL